VFCGVCLRRNIPDGLILVEYAAVNRKSGEYINRLLEKYLRQVKKKKKKRKNHTKKKKKKKKSEQTEETKEEKKKSNNDRKCK